MKLKYLLCLLLLSFATRLQGQTVQKGKLIYGMDQHPPYEFVDENGVPSGFNVDLIQAISNSLELEVVFKPGEWAKLRQEFEVDGTVDVLAMYKTTERDKLVDFSKTFNVIYHELFRRVDSKEMNIDSLPQLAGKEVTLEESAFLHEHLVANNYGIKVILVKNEVEGLELVASGKHDYAFISHTVGNYLISQGHVKNVVRSSVPFFPSDYCFAVKEGNAALLASINQGLTQIKTSGEYDEIYEKWFGSLNRKTILTDRAILYFVWITITVVIIMTLLYAWNRTLDSKVRKRTVELNDELKRRQEAELKIKSLAQSEINKLNQKLLIFIHKNPLAFIETDSGGSIINWNQSSEKMFGYSKNEVLGKNMISLITPLKDRLKAPTEDFQFATNGEQLKVNTHVTKTREEIICKWHNTPITDENENTIGWTYLIEDITESTRVQEEIKRTNEALNASNEKLKSQNIELEKQKKEILQQSNTIKETQAQLIHSEKMAVLGQLIAGVAHEVNTPLGAIKASVEMILESFPEIVEGLPSFFKKATNEDITLFVRFLYSVSKFKTFYSSREERAAKKQLVRFLEEAGIKHATEKAEMLADLKFFGDVTPYFTLLKRDDSLQSMSLLYAVAMQIKNSENIKMAVEKASKVIYALKSYSRSEHKEMLSEVNLKENIQTVLTLYHNQIKQGIEIAENYEGVKDLVIKCYPDQLNQVWANIIHNGIQAMEGKGTLSISIEELDKDICVKIQDSGKGVPEEIGKKIFLPFFTTKKAGEGSGLGLDIACKIIKRHAGNISFTSKPGNTTFKVTIPKKEVIEKVMNQTLS